VTFQATKQPTTPQWFKALDNLAGCYGSQTITMTVPQGTSVVNLMGDDATTASPNQLVGYVSRIELPGAERSQTSSNGLGPSTP
jgi:hypothetical protein